MLRAAKTSKHACVLDTSHSSSSLVLKWKHCARISCHRQKTSRQQRNVFRPCALLNSGPAYNKYRSRQDIEQDYYRDWERTTLLAEEERNRPMTVWTFLAFLPVWFKFIIPGPVRYVTYLLAQRMRKIMFQIHKKLVLRAAKFDVKLMKQGGIAPAIPSCKLSLHRLHGHVSVVENLKYWLALLQGKQYTVRISKKEEPILTPGPESQRLKPDDYDPSLDPWVAS